MPATVKVWVITHEELPAPRAGLDLAVWAPPRLPSETQLRTWAGWSETHLICHDGVQGTNHGFTPRPDLWPGTDVAVGGGTIWRWSDHYVAWLDAGDAAVPEIGRALALAGVSLIIGRSSTFSTPFLDPYWRLAQANQIFALVVWPEPRLYLPCEVDPDEDGVAQLSMAPGGAEADLEWGQLIEARRLSPIHRGLRPDLYKAHPWWSP